MNAEETIRELHKVESEHKNDKVLTFGIRIADMARDCANTIEELQAEVASLTAQLAELDRLRAENEKLHAEISDREQNSIDAHVDLHYWRDRAREAEKETEEREHEILDLRAKLDDPRTVRLPCAVGTTVYVVVTDCDCAYDGDMNACSECDYVIMPCDDFFRYDENEWECGFKPHVREDKFTLAMYDDFGKTVFLTREEAEKAKEAGK